MSSFFQKVKEGAAYAWEGTKGAAATTWEGTKVLFNDAKTGISTGMTVINTKIDSVTDVLRRPDSISDQEVVTVNHQMVDIIQCCDSMSNTLNELLNYIIRIEKTIVPPAESLAACFTEVDGMLFSKAQKFLYDSRSAQATIHSLASELYPQNVVGPYSEILAEYNTMRPKIKKIFDMKAQMDKSKEPVPQETMDKYNRKKTKYADRTAQLVEKLKVAQKRSFCAFLQYFEQLINILEPICSDATAPQLPYATYPQAEAPQAK